MTIKGKKPAPTPRPLPFYVDEWKNYAVSSFPGHDKIAVSLLAKDGVGPMEIRKRIAMVISAHEAAAPKLK